ncbi:sensor histidine kinase [Lutibacter holmesii]|uniref:Sensor histidine kinase n=1 Tax=Lutibacter holmesii TaxID=1137985 RepID=A0ABW3WQB7_9FLAO
MDKNKKITVFSHLLVWIVLVSMPYMLSASTQQLNINRVVAHFWIPLGFYAVIFYFNYFVLIDRYLFVEKTLKFIAFNCLIIALFVFLKELIESTFFEELSRNFQVDKKNQGPPIRMFIYIQSISYMAPLLFAIAIKSTKRWVKIEAERKDAANVKLQSELQHLHYQLQPHFFFNSLNNIYSLVDVMPEQAKTSIHGLGKLMRYMLYETNMELVPLSKEIDFMKKYTDLMKLRVSDKTVVNYKFPSTDFGIKIAPLLFISLVENAFKHGVAANKESSIDINMTCENKTVFFTIENDNLPKKTNDKSGSGIGLQNLEKRLQLLYPKKHIFKTAIQDNRFKVTLQIETD